MQRLRVCQAGHDFQRILCCPQVRSGGRLNVFAPIYELAQAQKSTAAKKSAQHKKVRPQQLGYRIARALPSRFRSGVLQDAQQSFSTICAAAGLLHELNAHRNSHVSRRLAHALALDPSDDALTMMLPLHAADGQAQVQTHRGVLQIPVRGSEAVAGRADGQGSRQQQDTVSSRQETARRLMRPPSRATAQGLRVIYKQGMPAGMAPSGGGVGFANFCVAVAARPCGVVVPSVRPKPYPAARPPRGPVTGPQ